MDATLQNPPRPSLLSQIKQLAIGLAVGGAFGVLGAMFAVAAPTRATGLSDLAKAGVVAFALFSFPLMIALHEVGHLLGGIAVGFRPLLFMVGPLRVEREGERFRVRVALKGAFFGGLAACAPLDTRDLRRRTLALIAGGPAINLVVGALLLALRPLAGPVGDLLLLVAGGMSLFIAVVALIPTPSGNFYSDGMRIVRLLRGGADVEREVASIALMGVSMGGVRAREWNPELVAQASAGGADTLFGVVGKLFGFYFQMDRGHTDAARAELAAVLGGLHILPKQSRPAVLLQAAFFAAHEDGDAPRARGYLAGSEGGLMIPPYLRPLAEAAIALAEGDRAAARAHLDAAHAGLSGGIDPGAALAAADRIAALRAEAAA